MPQKVFRLYDEAHKCSGDGWSGQKCMSSPSPAMCLQCLGTDLNVFPASRQKLPVAMQGEDISSQFSNKILQD